MYGDFGKTKAAESNSTFTKYLEPLQIHEDVQFTSIEYVKNSNVNPQPGEWKEALDYTITNDNGQVTGRFFDFAYNPKYMKDSVAVSKEEQEAEFGQKVKALFGSATSDERWEKGFEAKKPQNFEQLVALLKALCIKTENNKDAEGKDKVENFRVKVTLRVDANGKGFSTVPHYTGSVTERMSIPRKDTKLYISKGEIAKKANLKDQVPVVEENTEVPAPNITDVSELPF